MITIILRYTTVVPPNTTVLENERRYSETAVFGGSITLKTPILDLKWVRRYGEGGGVGREVVLGGAVLGGAVLGGTTVYRKFPHSSV